MEGTISGRARAAARALDPVRRFFVEYGWFRRMDEPDISDFTIGNPHELPPPGFVEALERNLVPRSIHWYAYHMNEPGPRTVLRESLRKWRGVDYAVEDLFLTNGATAALHVILSAIVDPGDEVIFISPPWFQYEGMILLAGGTPVRVRADGRTYDLDLDALEAAMTPKTRAVIVNSPHNPTGRIYPPETLRRLAEILARASKRKGSVISLVSDESYSRIVFDGRVFHSPTAFYPESFLVFTYGKVLLTPGQRIGYIALSPGMKGKDVMRHAIESLQMLAGWSFPNALMQHAFADIDPLSVDISGLQRRRDRVVSELRSLGYETTIPEGTFYVLARSPLADDIAFVRKLAEHRIFCIPGALMDLPGWFRISLTANDAMVERALPGFAEALRTARS